MLDAVSEQSPVPLSSSVEETWQILSWPPEPRCPAIESLHRLLRPSPDCRHAVFPRTFAGTQNGPLPFRKERGLLFGVSNTLSYVVFLAVKLCPSWPESPCGSLVPRAAQLCVKRSLNRELRQRLGLTLSHENVALIRLTNCQSLMAPFIGQFELK